ncbi:aminopeptidase [Bacteroidales bacterium OttesenSCG-928-M11]|nr:aminopeptidase [Bacteroidales bacterium OttesenSCG-928-M11]
MKRYFISLLIISLCFPTFAQEEKKEAEGFEFTTVKEIQITPVQNQNSSGTCWSFSGLGMIEAELLRMNKGEHILAPMYIARVNYEGKAKKYVRMHGETTFAAGGSFADVIDGIKEYGIVPMEVYQGLNYGDTIHRHGELDDVLKGYVNPLTRSRKLSTAWFEGFKGILDAYLGEVPETFVYQGKEYTPHSFAQSLGIVPDDYVSITSFTHHPFYSSFAIEVPDNWRWALSYNLPLDEMMAVVDNALENGYTVAWASDVSEKGFNRKGIAVMPDVKANEGPGSDQAHWLGISQKEMEARIANLTGPVPELSITQEMRQEAFDNFETTDDHGMLLYGIAKDQNGSKYYMVKNSWGTDSPYKGTWYASVPFVSYKTTNIVVHKDALPKDIKKKLNIK